MRSIIQDYTKFIDKVFPLKNPFLRNEKGVFCNFCKWISLPMAYVVYRMGISANLFDALGMLYSFVGFVLFVQILNGNSALALIGILIVLSHPLFDFIDGAVARARGYSSEVGGIFDDMGMDCDRLLVFVMIGLLAQSTVLLAALVISAFIIIWVVPNTLEFVPDNAVSRPVKFLMSRNYLFLGVRMVLGGLLLTYATFIILGLPLLALSRALAGIYIAHAVIWILLLIPEYPEFNLNKGGKDD